MLPLIELNGRLLERKQRLKMPLMLFNKEDWHFFPSKTGIGLTKQLEELLRRNDFSIFITSKLWHIHFLYLQRSFFSTNNSDWSLKDAKEYFNWFMSVKDERSARYLNYLSIQGEKLDFDVLGKKIYETLYDDEVSFRDDVGVFRLTNAGYAFAADTSIVLSDYIIKKYNGKVYWDIVKKPKSDIAYHLPALFGFNKLPYIELMGASVSHAKSILKKEQESYVWKRMVDLNHLF